MLIEPWERGWCKFASRDFKSELKLRFLWLLFLIINPLIFMFSLFYLSWFVRRRREEWWKVPVRERKWRRKDSQGKVGIGSHFSGGKMLSCERIQPKTILLTVREGFMSERGLQRPQESKNHGNPFCSSVTNMEAIFAVTNTTSAVVKIEPEKIQACKGFEPMTSAIPRSALPTELTSHHVGSK